jgi:pimeloyl-ACP methyl ester carboxylesterase
MSSTSNTFPVLGRRLRGTRTRGAVFVAVAATVTAAFTAVSGDAASPRTDHKQATRTGIDQVEAPVPDLSWRSCISAGLQCTRAAVPLDYDDPDGPTISLALIRHVATDPERRIGTLFVNPGGPGGSARLAAAPIADDLGADVAARFDVVGIDPRGVGLSKPLRCVASRDAAVVDLVPLTAEQEARNIRASTFMARSCARRSNAILRHMSTADTARDMDLIRQALGEEQLTYYGISYGTYLGATYAAMFPDRVRAVVLDGILDPVAWSTGRGDHASQLPFTTRIKSGVGAWEALTSAFAECDRVGKQRCKFAGESAEKWHRIVHRLRDEPFRTADGSIRYSDVIAGALSNMYARRGYRVMLRQVHVLYRRLFEGPAAPDGGHSLARFFKKGARTLPLPYASSTVATRPQAGPAKGVAFFPSFDGVACADSVNPRDPRAWIRAGRVADRQGPWFGRLWTWQSATCARWPRTGADAFQGPWRVETSNPLLLLANFHDPATAISGARVVNSLFSGSTLISLNTWGHGAIGQSDCVKKRVTRYLIDQQQPVDGLVCQPDKLLFPRHG